MIIKYLKEFLNKNITGRKISVLFILTNIIYAVMLMITIPNVMSYSGGMMLPDMMPTGYSADYVNQLMKNLGEKGKDAYLYSQIPLDMIYPLLFAVTYSLLLAYILIKLGKSEGGLYYFCYVPFFAGLFDYLENAGIIFILVSYPDNPDVLTQVTNIFSVLKSSLTTVFFIVFIISVIALVLKLISKKSKAQNS